MKWFFSTLLLCFICHEAVAQSAMTPYRWEELVEELCGATDEDADEDGIVLEESLLRELEERHSHPVAIHEAMPEDFDVLPFMTSEGIDQLLTYVYRHHGMFSWTELMLVPYLSAEAVRAIPLFFVLTPKDLPTQNKPKKVLRQEFASRIAIPLYYRKGFLIGSKGDGGKAYVGNPLYHNMRYTLKSSHVDVGLRTEKDTGERFYDSYGGHISVHDYGVLRMAVAGDFRIGFGEGLVLGGNSGRRYAAGNLNARSPQGVRAQTGLNEVGFMRGAAVTLGWGEWSATAFAAYNTMDGTPSPKSPDAIRTILNSGLHRTASEIDRKGNLHETAVGGHLEWKNKTWRVGVTGYLSHMDRRLQPIDSLTINNMYRIIMPNGRTWGVVGTDYEWRAYRWRVAGETSWSSQNNSFATINSVTYTASRKLQVGAQVRYYSPEYFCLHSSAMSENSRNQNETGVALMLSTQPLDYLMLEASADFFYFRWPRYRMRRSDAGQKFILKSTWTPDRKNSVVLRYQLKRKAVTDTIQSSHNIKLQWSYSPRNNWDLITTGTASIIRSERDNAGGNGFAIGEKVRCKLLDERLQATLSVSYFNTSNYNARVFIYEPSLWNASAFGTLYGKGVRTALLLRWQEKRWMLEAKYGLLHFTDRKTISSSYQQIFSPTKQDVEVQLRIRL